MNWYAIYTKPRCEDSVAFLLQNAGIEAISPKIRIKKYSRGRYAFVTEPLFRSYIFAFFDNDKYNHMIRYTRGVRYIVGQESPVIVPLEIIDAIRDRLEEGDIITPRPENLAKGDRVVVKEGPFADFYGIFERGMPGKDRIIILLEVLGSRLEIDDVSVRKV